MLRGTYYSNGTDNYRHNEFSHREWSAPTMVARYEIKRRIDSFNLVGRKVSDIRVFGHRDRIIHGDCNMIYFEDLPLDTKILFSMK